MIISLIMHVMDMDELAIPPCSKYIIQPMSESLDQQRKIELCFSFIN